MKNYFLKNDIPIFCVTVQPFPDGIIEAFRKLENLHPSVGERTLYGLSCRENGKVIYKAAVEESYDGEGKKYGCETFVISAGEYLSETILDFMKKYSQHSMCLPAAFVRFTVR